MAYEVVLKPSAKKALDELPRQARSRLIAALETLAENPRRHGVIKLESELDLYPGRFNAKYLHRPRAGVALFGVGLPLAQRPHRGQDVD